ncbi:MAG: hypothetical protein AB8G11_15080 [Saprospiraceae bacterium]
MKTILATSLLILISLITVKEAVYIALFQANQSYIAANYCENDNILDKISERTCQGKCYVQKIIVENNTDNSTNNHFVPTLDWEKTNLIIQDFNFSIPTIFNQLKNPIGKLLTDNQGFKTPTNSPPELG